MEIFICAWISVMCHFSSSIETQFEKKEKEGRKRKARKKTFQGKNTPWLKPFEPNLVRLGDRKEQSSELSFGSTGQPDRESGPGGHSRGSLNPQWHGMILLELVGL